MDTTPSTPSTPSMIIRYGLLEPGLAPKVENLTRLESAILLFDTPEDAEEYCLLVKLPNPSYYRVVKVPLPAGPCEIFQE